MLSVRNTNFGQKAVSHDTGCCPFQMATAIPLFSALPLLAGKQLSRIPNQVLYTIKFFYRHLKTKDPVYPTGPVYLIKMLKSTAISQERVW